jgi:multicomponent Na+:H+ antiporter subunit D
MVIPLCTTGAISVILGLYPALFMDFVRIFGKF